MQRLAADLIGEAATLPVVDSTPARRLGLATAMLVDMDGDRLLDLLGDDLDERANTLVRILDTTSDEDLEELFAAFHEAGQRRAARAARDERTSERVRQRSRRRRRSR